MKGRIAFCFLRAYSSISFFSLPENIVVSIGLLFLFFPLLFYVHLHYAGYWTIFPSFVLPSVYFGFSFIFFLFCLLVLSDPGRIKRASEHDISKKNLSENDISKKNISENDVSVSGKIPVLNARRYCNVCRVIKGPKAHHCSTCNICIEGFDHHCPWLANCIGKSNYFLFVAFIVITTVVEILMFVIYAKILFSCKQFCHLTFFVLIFTMFTAFRSLFFVILSAYHVYLIFSNKSTIEHIFP